MKDFFRRLRQGWRENTLRYPDPIGMTGRRPVEDEFRAAVDDLTSKLDMGSARSILDVGCSNGYLLKRLECRVPVQIGVDFCLEPLLAARIEHPPLKTALANATALPFPDACFDLVLCYNMYHYLPDTDTGLAVARELFRVLCGGGELLIGDIFTAEHRHLIPEADRVRWNAPDRPYLHRMENWMFMPVMDLKALFESYGAGVDILPQASSVRCPGYRYDVRVRKPRP